MDYLKPSDFTQLKAFFLALQQGHFKSNPKQASATIIVDGVRTPVDKAYCLELLRSFPDLQGDQFKDDSFLIKYLSDPNNMKRILGRLTPQQQIELTKLLEEKPGGQETSAEQGVSAQTPVDTAAGSMGVPGLPSVPSISFGPRRVSRIVQQTKPPGAESTTANIPGLKNTPETGLDYEGKPAEAKTGGRRFQAPKLPYQVTNAAKNFGSESQRFIGTNLGRIGRSLGGIAGGGIGAGGRALGRFGLKAVDFGANLSSAVSTRGSAFATAGRGGARFAVVGFLGFFLLTGLLTAFAPGSPGSSPPASTSTSASNFGLDYTLPIRDASIVPQDLKTQVLAAFPNAQIDNWDVIVEKSIAALWNPALLVALWIEESGAQGAAAYDDPLGCQPGVPTTDINISLNCVFNSYTTYTNDQFIEFMTRYGGGTPGKSLAGNANFPKFPDVVKSWYIRLVPAGPGAIKPVLAEALGCPVAATITNPYGYNIPDQPDTIKYAGCDSLSRCHNGIDFGAGSGSSVHATFEGEATAVGEDGIKGKYITVSNSASGFSATFEHLNSQNIAAGASVKRSQLIGTVGSTGISYGVHLHYRLEKNSKLVNPFRYLGSSAAIAPISLIQSDELNQNDYTGKPASFDWGRCTNVP